MIIFNDAIYTTFQRCISSNNSFIQRKNVIDMLEIFIYSINITSRRLRFKMTESSYIWTIKCQFKVVVRQKINPSLNNLFLDIILRHFNKMAHENVNILLLNYAHNKVKTHSNPKKDNKQSSEKFFEYY